MVRGRLRGDPCGWMPFAWDCVRGHDRVHVRVRGLRRCAFPAWHWIHVLDGAAADSDSDSDAGEVGVGSVNVSATGERVRVRVLELVLDVEIACTGDLDGAIENGHEHDLPYLLHAPVLAVQIEFEFEFQAKVQLRRAYNLLEVDLDLEFEIHNYFSTW